MKFNAMKFINHQLVLVALVAFCAGSLASAQLVETKAADAQDASEVEEAAATEAAATEEPAAEPVPFSVAGGSLNFSQPGQWKSVPPRSRMLEYEIKIPNSQEKGKDGRLTIMGAGGSIEANVRRWEGQFSQPDGSATAAKEKKIEVAEMPVTMVDITGTYIETMGGPFSGGKKVENGDYRMLAAIIETPESGNYFVKFMGPSSLVKENEKAFESMIQSATLTE